MELGLEYLEQEEYSKARSQFMIAAESQGNSGEYAADAQHNVGLCYVNEGNYEEGRKWLQKAKKNGCEESSDALEALEMVEAVLRELVEELESMY